MLYQFRRHLRVLAAAVLVITVCRSVAGPRSRTGSTITTPTAPRRSSCTTRRRTRFAARSQPDGERPVHCVLCHWTRAFGPSLQSVSVAHALASRTLAVQAVDIGLFHSGAAVQPPLRAPPVPPAVDVFA